MGVEESFLLDELKEFAESEYVEQIISLLHMDDFRRHFSILIDAISLFESCVLFAHYIFENPVKSLEYLNEAFQQAALAICKTHKIKDDMFIEGNIHIRLNSLPNMKEIYRENLPTCLDIDQFMCIHGTIIRTSTCKMVPYRKIWKCRKCKLEFVIEASIVQDYVYEKPTVCPNLKHCNGKSFILLTTDVDPKYCKDYQEVKLQEQIHSLAVGCVPRSMWIILEDDLVDSCRPGNDVYVSGILIRRWKSIGKGKLIDVDLVVVAHSIEIKNKMNPASFSPKVTQQFGSFWSTNRTDPLKGRNMILASICPQIFGLYIVKLAVALVLARGVQKKDGDYKVRGNSHLLLVGDPGTGKSQILKFATKISMLSVITSGVGTTNAGLTVSAVKEGGRWQLEAGALVLADGGICCIDEFNCMKEQDKSCIHEAMEQQTISVAKAGLVCSLSTRCSILAATNTKEKYDEALSLSENVALSSPLISRFDIILVLLDVFDEKWDKMASSYIVQGQGHVVALAKDTWNIEKLKIYFSLIQNISPKMTPSCNRILQEYYKKQRNSENRNLARTTPRLLQSLIRLAEGHARLMFRSEALVIDAVIAILMVESSMSGSAALEELVTPHTPFPSDPKTEYREKAMAVLKCLHLECLIEDVENYQQAYADSNVSHIVSEISVCHMNRSSLRTGYSLNNETNQTTHCPSPNSIGSDKSNPHTNNDTFIPRNSLTATKLKDNSQKFVSDATSVSNVSNEKMQSNSMYAGREMKDLSQPHLKSSELKKVETDCFKNVPIPSSSSSQTSNAFIQPSFVVGAKRKNTDSFFSKVARHARSTDDDDGLDNDIMEMSQIPSQIPFSNNTPLHMRDAFARSESNGVEHFFHSTPRGGEEEDHWILPQSPVNEKDQIPEIEDLEIMDIALGIPTRQETIEILKATLKKTSPEKDTPVRFKANISDQLLKFSFVDKDTKRRNGSSSSENEITSNEMKLQKSDEKLSAPVSSKAVSSNENAKKVQNPSSSTAEISTTEKKIFESNKKLITQPSKVVMPNFSNFIGKFAFKGKDSEMHDNPITSKVKITPNEKKQNESNERLNTTHESSQAASKRAAFQRIFSSSFSTKDLDFDLDNL